MYKEKLQMLLLHQFKSVAYIMMNRKGKLSCQKIQLTPKSIEENESYFFSTALLVAKIDETDLRSSGLQKCMM